MTEITTPPEQLDRAAIDQFVRETQEMTSAKLTEISQTGRVDLRQRPPGLTTVATDESTGESIEAPADQQLTQWPAQPAELLTQLEGLQPGPHRLSWMVPTQETTSGRVYLFSQRSPTIPEAYMIGRGTERHDVTLELLETEETLMPQLNSEPDTLAQIWHGHEGPGGAHITNRDLSPLAAFTNVNGVREAMAKRWREMRDAGVEGAMMVQFETRWLDPAQLKALLTPDADGNTQYELADIYEGGGQPRAGIKLHQPAGTETATWRWEVPLVAGIGARDVAAVGPGLLMLIGLHSMEMQPAPDDAAAATNDNQPNPTTTTEGSPT